MKTQLKIAIQGISLMVIYGLLAITLFNQLRLYLGFSSVEPLMKWNGFNESFGDFIALPLIAFIEECVFRLLPIVVIYKVFKEQLSNRNLLILAIISSSIFGYMHGSVVTIFIQGVLGGILFWVFYKEYQITNSLWKAVFMSTFVHAVYNYYLFFF